jgi:hypothetical protein
MLCGCLRPQVLHHTVQARKGCAAVWSPRNREDYAGKGECTSTTVYCVKGYGNGSKHFWLTSRATCDLRLSIVTIDFHIITAMVIKDIAATCLLARDQTMQRCCCNCNLSLEIPRFGKRGKQLHITREYNKSNQIPEQKGDIPGHRLRGQSKPVLCGYVCCRHWPSTLAATS